MYLNRQHRAPLLDVNPQPQSLKRMAFQTCNSSSCWNGHRRGTTQDMRMAKQPGAPASTGAPSPAWRSPAAPCPSAPPSGCWAPRHPRHPCHRPRQHHPWRAPAPAARVSLSPGAQCFLAILLRLLPSYPAAPELPSMRSAASGMRVQWSQVRPPAARRPSGAAAPRPLHACARQSPARRLGHPPGWRCRRDQPWPLPHCCPPLPELTMRNA